MKQTEKDICRTLLEIINEIPNTRLQELLGLSGHSVVQLKRSGTGKVDFQKLVLFLSEKGFIQKSELI